MGETGLGLNSSPKSAMRDWRLTALTGATIGLGLAPAAVGAPSHAAIAAAPLALAALVTLRPRGGRRGPPDLAGAGGPRVRPGRPPRGRGAARGDRRGRAPGPARHPDDGDGNGRRDSSAVRGRRQRPRRHAGRPAADHGARAGRGSDHRRRSARERGPLGARALARRGAQTPRRGDGDARRRDRAGPGWARRHRRARRRNPAAGGERPRPGDPG